MWSVIVGLLFFVLGTIGYRKGLVDIALSLCATIVAIALVAIITPILSNAIIEYTEIDDRISDSFVEYILANEKVVYQIGEDIEVYDEVQAVMDIQLPTTLQEKILQNNTLDMYELLGVSNFYEYVGRYIANWIVKLATFVAVMIAVFIFMKMFVFSLLVITKVPLINGVNRLGGLVIGALTAILILWLVFIVADLMHQMQWSINFLADVRSIKFFEILYKNNPIMNVLIH